MWIFAKIVWVSFSSFFVFLFAQREDFFFFYV